MGYIEFSSLVQLGHASTRAAGAQARGSPTAIAYKRPKFSAELREKPTQLLGSTPTLLPQKVENVSLYTFLETDLQ